MEMLTSGKRNVEGFDVNGFYSRLDHLVYDISNIHRREGRPIRVLPEHDGRIFYVDASAGAPRAAPAAGAAPRPLAGALAPRPLPPPAAAAPAAGAAAPAAAVLGAAAPAAPAAAPEEMDVDPADETEAALAALRDRAMAALNEHGPKSQEYRNARADADRAGAFSRSVLENARRGAASAAAESAAPAAAAAAPAAGAAAAPAPPTNEARIADDRINRVGKNLARSVPNPPPARPSSLLSNHGTAIAIDMVPPDRLDAAAEAARTAFTAGTRTEMNALKKELEEATKLRRELVGEHNRIKDELAAKTRALTTENEKTRANLEENARISANLAQAVAELEALRAERERERAAAALPPLAADPPQGPRGPPPPPPAAAAAAAAEAEAAAQRLAAAERRVKDLKRDLADVKRRREENDRDVATLTAERDSLRSASRLADERDRTQSAAINKLNKELGEARGTLAALTGEKNTLAIDVGLARDANAQLSAKITILENAIATERTARGDAQALVDGLKTRISQHGPDAMTDDRDSDLVGDFERLIKTKDASITSMESTLESLTRERNDLVQQATEMDNTIKMLREALEINAREIARLRGANEEASKNLEHARRDHDSDSGAASAAATARITAAEAAAANARKELSDAEARHGEELAKAAETYFETARARDDLTRQLQEAATSAESEYKVLRESKAEVEKRLGDLAARVQNVTRSYEEYVAPHLEPGDPAGRPTSEGFRVLGERIAAARTTQQQNVQEIADLRQSIGVAQTDLRRVQAEKTTAEAALESHKLKLKDTEDSLAAARRAEAEEREAKDAANREFITASDKVKAMRDKIAEEADKARHAAAKKTAEEMTAQNREEMRKVEEQHTATLAQYQSTLEQRTGELVAANARLDEAKQASTRAEAAAADAVANLERGRTEYKALAEAALAAKTAADKFHDETYEPLRVKYNKLVEALNAKDAQLRGLHAEAFKEVSARDARIGELQAAASEAAGDNARLRGELTRMEKMLGEAEHAAAAGRGEIDKLKSELIAAQEESADIETYMSDASSELATTSRRQTVLETTVEQLAALIAAPGITPWWIADSDDRVEGDDGFIPEPQDAIFFNALPKRRLKAQRDREEAIAVMKELADEGGSTMDPPYHETAVTAFGIDPLAVTRNDVLNNTALIIDVMNKLRDESIKVRSDLASAIEKIKLVGKSTPEQEIKLASESREFMEAVMNYNHTKMDMERVFYLAYSQFTRYQDLGFYTEAELDEMSGIMEMCEPPTATYGSEIIKRFQLEGRDIAEWVREDTKRQVDMFVRKHEEETMSQPTESVIEEIQATANKQAMATAATFVVGNDKVLKSGFTAVLSSPEQPSQNGGKLATFTAFSDAELKMLEKFLADFNTIGKKLMDGEVVHEHANTLAEEITRTGTIPRAVAQTMGNFTNVIRGTRALSQIKSPIRGSDFNQQALQHSADELVTNSEYFIRAMEEAIKHAGIKKSIASSLIESNTDPLLLSVRPRRPYRHPPKTFTAVERMFSAVDPERSAMAAA